MKIKMPVNAFFKKYWISYALVYTLFIVLLISSILNGSQTHESATSDPSTSLGFLDIVLNYPFGLTVILCFYKALGERKPNFNDMVRIYIKIVLWEMGLVAFPVWAFFAIKKIHNKKHNEWNVASEDTVDQNQTDIDDEYIDETFE